MVRPSDTQLDGVLQNGFDRELVVTVLHGTNPVAREVSADTWSLSGDMGRDPKVTGTVRIVHPSLRGESWLPTATRGVLSPHRTTLLLTEVIRAGRLERRVQLGLFDIAEVPTAEDAVATVRGRQITVATVVDADVESLDARVLSAAFRSPRTAETSARAEWRTIGLLPVITTGADATVPPTTWPAENGSRLDAVQTVARLLGGEPVVDSFGQWVLVGENSSTVTLRLGAHGTVTDLTSTVSLQGFANVVIGSYETATGEPIRAVWTAPGRLSPDAMGREYVSFHTSDLVRTQNAADAAVAAEGDRLTSQDVDVEVVCVYNPLLELGDRAEVVDDAGARVVAGVVRTLNVSEAETMSLVIRERRPL